MRKTKFISILCIMGTLMLAGCQDGGGLGSVDQPVTGNEEVKAAMSDAAQKLKGKWRQIQSGSMPVSGNDAIYMEFDGEMAMTFITKLSDRQSTHQTYACTFAYNWRYSGATLAGTFYLRQESGYQKGYMCTIEDDGKKIKLYAPADSEHQVDDPTMWFEKMDNQEQDSDNDDEI